MNPIKSSTLVNRWLSPFLFSLLIALAGASATAIELDNDDVAAIGAVAPRVHLSHLVFDVGTSISASVTYSSTAQRSSSHDVLVLYASETNDFEQLVLYDDQQPRRRSSAGGVATGFSGGNGSTVPMDGRLDVTESSVVVGIVSYPGAESGVPLQEMVSMDYALPFDPNFAASPSFVDASIAMDDDEADADVHGKSLATFFVSEAELAAFGQAAVDTVLFAPESNAHLNRFLQRTSGTLVEDLPNGSLPEWVEVRLSPPTGHRQYAPQLRDLVGDGSELRVSRGEALDLYAYALELFLEGFRVALDPRVQLTGDVRSYECDATDAFAGDDSESGDAGACDRDQPTADPMQNPVYGVREMWAAMAMWDADLEKVYTGFIDQGFANNADWRGYPSETKETDLWTLDKSTGAAIGPPTVGASFFGKPNWHGTSVISVAGGLLNNGDGAVGTGGQVVVPYLYEMSGPSVAGSSPIGAIGYASRIDTGIREAVADGAQVINLSGGFPCRMLWILGPENLCTALGRAAFYVKLDLITTTLSTLGCGAMAAIPGLGPVASALCFATTSVTFGLAKAAVAAILISTDTRGMIEAAVDDATAEGVVFVASTLNDLDPGEMGVFEDLMTEAQLANLDADDWQMVPCVIPDVICVSSSFPDSEYPHAGDYVYYASEDGWGDSVDLWAPIRTRVFRPDSEDLTAPYAPVLSGGFSGSSAAAPYVAGLIANMMAINDGLNPARTESSAIPSIVAELLDDTAYKPGIASADGTTVLPQVADAPVVPSDEIAERMEVRRNMVNPYAAWQAAAAGLIPNLAGTDFDTDFGHLSDGEGVMEGGDGVGDSAAEAVPLLATAGFSPAAVADEIHFVWPQGAGVPVEIDEDHFFWTAPDLGDDSLMFRQELQIRVPEHPKSILWLSETHGETIDVSLEGIRTYSFFTPWVEPGREIDLAIGTPRYTDTPYVIDVVGYEESARPEIDDYDSDPSRNESPSAAATIVGTMWYTVPGLSGDGFENIAYVLNVGDLTLHETTDQDWFLIQPPNPGDFTSSCADSETPIAWIRVEGSDPNLEIEVYEPTTLTKVASGPGDRPLALRCGQYGGLAWTTHPLAVGVRSVAETLGDYSLSFRVSVPRGTVASCWKCIVESTYAPATSLPSDTLPEAVCDHPGSGPVPEYEWMDAAHLYPDLESPDYGFTGGHASYDAGGHSLRPMTYIVRHPSDGEFRASAFLGHDTDLSGADQSLRMDLYNVNNCQWIAGVLSLEGEETRLSEPGMTPAEPLVEVGDIDLFVDSLGDGDYMLALSYFEEGDTVDLVLSETSSVPSSISVENVSSAYGSPRVIIPVEPVPEPGGIAMLAAGLVALLVSARSRSCRSSARDPV